MVRFLVPLGVFILLAVLLFTGLWLDPKLVPSPLIGKPAPGFELARLKDPESTITQNALKGKVALLNVWATWCVSCRAEHEVLMELARKNVVAIYGLNYKDVREDAQRWLRQLGNPYVANAFDRDGRVGIDWGVYGTPETFVIDQNGIVRYKHVGPITPQVLTDKILPLVNELKSNPA